MATAFGLTTVLPIRTERLLLRPFKLDDADALYELHGDAMVTRYAGGTKTREESRASLLRLVRKGGTTGLAALAMEESASNEVVGWAGIQLMPEADRVASIPETSPFELIYAVRPDKWDNGFATEAATVLLSYAFRMDNPKIDLVYGLVFPQNVRSIRVLDKVGMTFVQHFLHQVTQRYACLYRVTRAQFAAHLSSSK